MIIANILNTKTKEQKDLTFHSYESMVQIINNINQHQPEIGFLMIGDFEEIRD